MRFAVRRRHARKRMKGEDAEVPLTEGGGGGLTVFKKSEGIFEEGLNVVSP